MGKEKKEKKSVDESQNEGEAEEMSYEDRLKYVSVISKPMAPKKLTKKVSNFSYFLEANKSKALETRFLFKKILISNSLFLDLQMY